MKFVFKVVLVVLHGHICSEKQPNFDDCCYKRAQSFTDNFRRTQIVVIYL